MNKTVQKQQGREKSQLLRHNKHHFPPNTKETWSLRDIALKKNQKPKIRLELRRFIKKNTNPVIERNGMLPEDLTKLLLLERNKAASYFGQQLHPRLGCVSDEPSSAILSLS